LEHARARRKAGTRAGALGAAVTRSGAQLSYPESLFCSNLLDYYAYLGPRAELVAQGILHTAEQIKGAIQAFADLGVDEVILFPGIPDADQFARIAEIVK
jgi:hypothetical protein